MIRNIKYTIFYIIEIFNFIKLNKYTHKKKYDNIYLNISYDFLKVQWLQ